MHTEKGQPSIIRKGPLGISKAIALEQYSGDMAFYANHDLVARTREEGHSEDPNPFSKEEHQAFYKATFTIDSKMIGKDEWFIPNQPEYDEVEEFLSLKLSAKKNAETKKISCAKQDETTFINRQNGSKNKIEISPVSEDGDGTWSVKFSLDKKEKSQRILQILKALKSGLYSKSSGETNPIVPLFFMAAPVRVPVPVLHPHLDIVRERESWRVIGVKDGIQNDWIEGDVYLSHSEKLPPAGDLPEKGLTHSWDGFICSVGLSSGE
jgi:CRISPR-associated protein Cst2